MLIFSTSNARMRMLAIAVSALIAWPTFSRAADEPKPGRVLKSYEKPYPTFGKIKRLDPRFDKLIPLNAELEKLAEGFAWSEGPIWIKDGGYLLFSDIPNNLSRKWKEGEGLSVYMQPSGYTGATKRGGEPGTNGLTVDSQGRLTMCEHGDRRITRLEHGKKTVLADKFEGKRFNSPNDLTYNSKGDLYFTDPPYGLEKNWDDPARELDFCGVYRLSKDGQLSAVIKDLTRPNGLAFSPDEKHLYIAVSDNPNNAVYMIYDVNSDGTVTNGRKFFDASDWAKASRPGAPDGMKVDKDGNLWATGPGGIYVFAPDATLLGNIDTGERTANLNWGEDGSTLFVCADAYLGRIKTGTKGAGW